VHEVKVEGEGFIFRIPPSHAPRNVSTSDWRGRCLAYLAMPPAAHPPRSWPNNLVKDEWPQCLTSQCCQNYARISEEMLKIPEKLPGHPAFLELPTMPERHAQNFRASLQGSAGQELPERWLGGTRSESHARGTGAVYGESKGSCESVAGSSDGAFVAAAPLCAYRSVGVYRNRPSRVTRPQALENALKLCFVWRIGEHDGRKLAYKVGGRHPPFK